jgi:hypothetical protein
MTEDKRKELRDVARNSYVVGYEAGFAQGKKEAKRLALALGVWAVIIAVGFVLVGCTPYAGFVAGYSEDGGDYYTMDGYDIRENGGSAIAYIGARREVTDSLTVLCQGTHFSTFTNRPEVTVNHIGCGVEIK